MQGWRQRWVGTGFCLGLWLMPAAMALAQPQPAPDSPRAFLQKVQQAARQLDYSGVIIYQQGQALQASSLVHLVDGTGERERLERLDGAPRECLRHNGMQQCLQPEQRLVSLGPARGDHFPALLLDADALIAPHYDWQPTDHLYRVAGRECRVSLLKARDALRYSYRICTDVKNHLLLKSQTLDGEGHLVDQVAFSQVEVGANVSSADLVSRWNTRDWVLRPDSSQPIDLAAQGWRITPPPGFQVVAQVSRPLGPRHEVDQMVLSDGLAAISIFIETFDPDRDQSIRQGSLHQGAMSIYRLRLSSYWLTAVGEVPAQTVQDLAQGVQHVPQAAH